jgi:hypothetical protein
MLFCLVGGGVSVGVGGRGMMRREDCWVEGIRRKVLPIVVEEFISD